MATLRRLQEAPRHLLVCEKSNFGHDKSHHKHLVETHYHNYRVSQVHPVSLGLERFKVEPRRASPGKTSSASEGGPSSSFDMLGTVVTSFCHLPCLALYRTTIPSMHQTQGGARSYEEQRSFSL